MGLGVIKNRIMKFLSRQIIDYVERLSYAKRIIYCQMFLVKL